MLHEAVDQLLAGRLSGAGSVRTRLGDLLLRLT